MLHGVFRTKEGKLIVIIFVMVVMIAVGLVYTRYQSNMLYEEQTVMAEKFLQAGNYEQAVEAYLKALSMNNSDQETLTIGLAESYIGINDYDKALEVLRTCYQKTSGIKIKEKIEDVTTRKTEYEYLQIISRADIYFTNKEYDKAIAEYEKAKKIKSKEVTSYRRISEAYIEIGDFNQAFEEVTEGIALTQSEELNATLDRVNSYLTKQQYETLITQATEYIYQENYEDGVMKYEEATRLMPEEVQAYSGLAQAYLALEEYQKAATLLQGALEHVYSTELKELLDQASEYVAALEEQRKVLLELYEAVGQIDIKKITEIINSEIFIKDIAVNAPIYFSPWSEGDKVKSYGMIVYDHQNIYLGRLNERIKKGSGIYFMLTSKYGKQGYYYYQGEWNDNKPNGIGTTVEESTIQSEDGKKYSKKIVTDGIFYNGIENGSMHKYFYTDEKETGNVMYSARKGNPIPFTPDNELPITIEKGKAYPIGKLYLNDEPTGDYYWVDSATYWGVKPFMQ